jgi:hypothetical protein
MASKNERRLELFDSFERLAKEREVKNVLICFPYDGEVE